MMRTMILASTVAISQAYNHADQALRFQGVSTSMTAPAAAPTVDPSTQYVELLFAFLLYFYLPPQCRNRPLA